jgi:hypothetical protein
MIFLWEIFNVIFNFQLNLGQSHYCSRINGVGTVNLSPLSLFYTLPNAHNFLENISLMELYFFSYNSTGDRASLCYGPSFPGPGTNRNLIFSSNYIYAYNFSKIPWQDLEFYETYIQINTACFRVLFANIMLYIMKCYTLYRVFIKGGKQLWGVIVLIKTNKKCPVTICRKPLSLAASRHFLFFTKKLITQKIFKLQKTNLARVFIW